jgi:hypothetical protein
LFLTNRIDLRSLIVKISFLLLILTVSCSTNVKSVLDAGLQDNQYDKDFGIRENTNSLDNIAKSVMMLNCIAYYNSYLFDKNSKITPVQISSLSLEDISISRIHSTETASGSATVIYSGEGSIALLTCAHIISFPDTVYTYFKNSLGGPTEYIESISIKSRQTNLLPELTISSEVEIIAIDADSDIALIGREIRTLDAGSFVPLGVSWGNSSELGWGTKVYIIGYPLNNKMITSGLVSPPPVLGRDYFFVDAVFNRGFSGGIVLAVRDGAPNFELVGMVKSGTIQKKYNVVPDYNDPDYIYLPQVPYEGTLLVEEDIEMKYGVTKIMSVEEIIRFLEREKDSIEANGFRTSKFVK